MSLKKKLEKLEIETDPIFESIPGYPTLNFKLIHRSNSVKTFLPGSTKSENQFKKKGEEKF